MLDGYLTAIIVGPCSINPYEWMDHMLGPHSAIGVKGTEQSAAIMAIAGRFNAVSKGLSTAPERYAPIFERTDDGTVLAGPWCMGFLAALKLRCDAWRPLLDLSRIEHGLLLPILLHCTDDAGRPMLGPVRPGPKAEAFLRNAYHDIQVLVPTIREYYCKCRSGFESDQAELSVGFSQRIRMVRLTSCRCEDGTGYLASCIRICAEQGSR